LGYERYQTEGKRWVVNCRIKYKCIILERRFYKMDIKDCKPIPEIEVPTITNFKEAYIDEELVGLSDVFKVRSQYYYQGIAGALPECYVRKTVKDKLLEARSYLPEGLDFMIYDGYRPICVQQRLWNYYRRDIANKNPGLSDEEIDYKTSFFVSKPSYDELSPSLHNTGGAVDLTLVTTSGLALNMGTLFDDFTDRAWTNHFEMYTDCEEVKINRRILYNAMLKAGFTNLPSEWWHYDYGDKFWAYFKNEPRLYKGMPYKNDLPNPFPLC
jgi:D-alanyl-D-alanine dipeptidase